MPGEDERYRLALLATLVRMYFKDLASFLDRVHAQEQNNFEEMNIKVDQDQEFENNKKKRDGIKRPRLTQDEKEERGLLNRRKSG